MGLYQSLPKNELSIQCARGFVLSLRDICTSLFSLYRSVGEGTGANFPAHLSKLADAFFDPRLFAGDCTIFLLDECGHRNYDPDTINDCNLQTAYKLHRAENFVHGCYDPGAIDENILRESYKL